MKKIISILVFVMVLFCLSGCMQKNFQEIAVDYMTEKYDEEFEWICPVGGQFGSNQHSGYVRCSLFPEEQILVSGEKNGNQYAMSDNFLEYYLQEELEDMMVEFLRQAGVDCQVEWHPAEVAVDVAEGKSIDPVEYLNQYGARVSLYFAGEPAEKDAVMEMIRQTLFDQGIFADVTVFFSPQEEAKGFSPQGRFLIDEDGIFQIYKWK